MIYMENPLKHRYYLLMVEKDIFSTWCLKKIFGSTITKRGRTIIQVFANEKLAWAELTEIEYVRRQRGYIYADIKLYDQLVLRPQNLYEINNKKPYLAKAKILRSTTSKIKGLRQPNLF